MRTIAFTTQKGGAGKTTLAVALAVAATEAGEKVIALDLDPQGSLSAWGDDREAEAPAVDRIDADKLARLPDVLKALAKGGFTVALLDCPGIADTRVNAAIAAADLCLVPARPTMIDLRATKATIAALLKLDRPFAFVLNQAPPTAKTTRMTEAVGAVSMLGDLADPFITQRNDYQDAVAAGQGVTEYAPQGKAADEVRQLWRWVDRKMKGAK